MPHLVIEYSDNLKADGELPRLLSEAAAVIAQQQEDNRYVFPVGGIRVRAIEIREYSIADGKDDYAFLHASLMIGAGRSESAKKKVGDELFALIKSHFASIYASRYLALSLEVNEFDEAGTWKHNNIHTRFKNA